MADTLNQVLSGECDDDILRSLYVVSVTAAPDAAQLLVVVAPVLPEEPLQPVEVIERLSARAGQLRHAVATSITRRRAPRLIYQYSGNPLALERESPPLPVSDTDAESRID